MKIGYTTAGLSGQPKLPERPYSIVVGKIVIPQQTISDAIRLHLRIASSLIELLVPRKTNS